MDTIVIEISAEHKDMADAFRQLLDLVTRREAALDNGGRAIDFAKVEGQIATACQRIECAAVRPVLSALDVDAEHISIGDQKFRRVERCEGTYHCRSGDVRAMRSLYRTVGERNARVVDPISLRAGVVGDGWLPQTAAAMAFLLQLGTSREAEATAIETATLPFSRSSFERVGHLVGEQLVGAREAVEQVLIEENEPPAEAHSVSASLDRVSIPMEEPAPAGSEQKVVRQYRMAFCGTVTLHDEAGEALETIRYGRMPEGSAEDLCDSLLAEVLELLSNKPSLKVVLLADGAHEMWNLLTDAFTEDRLRGVELIELVDFYHLSEKLAAAAKKLCPTYEKLREQKVGRWKLLLLNRRDGAEKIFAELEASGLEEEDNSECPVHAAMTYLTNHRGRFDYASARAAGLPIGSGAVESSCKTLFEVRMKRSGSRWKEESGAHIIHLRALALSDRWQRGLQLALAPLRSNVRVAA